MKIGPSTFVAAATGKGGWPTQPRPEVAFAGRSNVGKSSLINTLLGRKALARISSRPGRTKTLGFIEVEAASRALRLCDFPGYGYARVSKKERASWGRMIEDYIKTRETLRLVVCLVDARHEVSPLDQQMVEWLDSLGQPLVLVATKVDKVPKAQRSKIDKRLDFSGLRALQFSSSTGEGKDALWQKILLATSKNPEE